jgi:hypothetical protein
MASQIDPTVIQDDVKVDKADLREQLGIARDEITALQLSVSSIRRMAYSDASFDEL